MIGIFGNIQAPKAIQDFENAGGGGGNGIFVFLSAIFKLAGTIAGIYFVIQIIIAGYTYLSANGDEKKTAQAWATIWQSLIGIVIVASAFVLTNTIGHWLGLNILNPEI
ncbi:MAG: hypothetical protein PHE32_00635 [Candidatus Shapirobacteria bacterium]|nr:hypothetical protein [Candidatus Shapirobacteria bacterium]MDD4410203.1 hypothetical protein [Candidatus Shapirobacteria bacterium]